MMREAVFRLLRRAEDAPPRVAAECAVDAMSRVSGEDVDESKAATSVLLLKATYTAGHSATPVGLVHEAVDTLIEAGQTRTPWYDDTMATVARAALPLGIEAALHDRTMPNSRIVSLERTLDAMLRRSGLEATSLAQCRFDVHAHRHGLKAATSPFQRLARMSPSIASSCDACTTERELLYLTAKGGVEETLAAVWRALSVMTGDGFATSGRCATLSLLPGGRCPRQPVGVLVACAEALLEVAFRHPGNNEVATGCVQSVRMAARLALRDSDRGALARLAAVVTLLGFHAEAEYLAEASSAAPRGWELDDVWWTATMSTVQGTKPSWREEADQLAGAFDARNETHAVSERVAQLHRGFSAPVAAAARAELTCVSRHGVFGRTIATTDSTGSRDTPQTPRGVSRRRPQLEAAAPAEGELSPEIQARLDPSYRGDANSPIPDETTAAPTHVTTQHGTGPADQPHLAYLYVGAAATKTDLREALADANTQRVNAIVNTWWETSTQNPKLAESELGMRLDLDIALTVPQREDVTTKALARCLVNAQASRDVALPVFRELRTLLASGPMDDDAWARAEQLLDRPELATSASDLAESWLLVTTRAAFSGRAAWVQSHANTAATALDVTTSTRVPGRSILALCAPPRQAPRHALAALSALLEERSTPERFIRYGVPLLTRIASSDEPAVLLLATAELVWASLDTDDNQLTDMVWPCVREVTTAQWSNAHHVVDDSERAPWAAIAEALSAAATAERNVAASDDFVQAHAICLLAAGDTLDAYDVAELLVGQAPSSLVTPSHQGRTRVELDNLVVHSVAMRAARATNDASGFLWHAHCLTTARAGDAEAWRAVAHHAETRGDHRAAKIAWLAEHDHYATAGDVDMALLAGMRAAWAEYHYSGFHSANTVLDLQQSFIDDVASATEDEAWVAWLRGRVSLARAELCEQDRSLSDAERYGIEAARALSDADDPVRVARAHALVVRSLAGQDNIGLARQYAAAVYEVCERREVESYLPGDLLDTLALDTS